MGAIELIKKPLELIYCSATKLGYVPRRPFAHYYLNAEGIKSRIHLQNFYSSFCPEVNEAATATFTVFDRSGRQTHRFSRELVPFGQIYLEMDEYSNDESSSEGMVFVDLEPGPAVKKKFSKLPNPEEVSIATPFWMSYRDEDENYMYVHSISTVEGEVKGGITPINWKLSRNQSARPTWKSWRLLDVQLLDDLQVVAMNHSNLSGDAKISVFADNGDVLWSEKVSLATKQVERLRVPQELIAYWKHERISDHIRIGMDPLLSSNGKPYIVMKYAGGPLSLHHG